MSDAVDASTVATIEVLYRTARDRRDRAEIAAARTDKVAPTAERAAGEALAALRQGMEALDQRPPSDQEAPSTVDTAALAVMRHWLRQATADQGADTYEHDTDEHDTAEHHEAEHHEADTSGGRTSDEFSSLAGPIEGAYAAAQGAVDIGGGAIITRLGVLERLATEPDPDRRRELFAALRPVWATIDGDGTVSGSPYQRELLPLSRRRWAAGASPVVANARALGLDPSTVEPSLLAILETWRGAFAGGAPIEPWDWWHVAGAANRELNAAIPLERIQSLSDAYHSSLGADPVALGVRFDVFPRPGRPSVPVAYTDFGGRPEHLADGSLVRSAAWVMGTYTAGGLGELTELIHETGHAIHIAAIDTRPAFADWPDSDAFTEALAELTALDTAEPAWQEYWLGASVRTDVSLRGRYADVMLDICWAVLEMRLHASPDADPNAVWTDLTSRYLGIAAHPELSWWAMRGQLVQEPGYMVNYALGPILAADMRAAIRRVRGDWSSGDPGWYEWVSERLYRWGLERGSGAVLALLLGRAPTPSALVEEIRRGVRRQFVIGRTGSH